MKQYVKPLFECIEVRTEERLAAGCKEMGSCEGEDIKYFITIS